MLYKIEHIDGNSVPGIWAGDSDMRAIRRMLDESGDPAEDSDYYTAKQVVYSVMDYVTGLPLNGRPSDELVLQCVMYENGAYVYEAVQASFEVSRWEPNSRGSHRVYVVLD